MEVQVILFKILPYVVYSLSIILACTSGIMVYAGLSSKQERVLTRLRFRQNIIHQQTNMVLKAKGSAAEKWFEQAKYPLGLNSIKYYVFYYGLFGFLIIYYVFLPMFINQEVSLWALILISAGVFLLHPGIPYSLFVYVMKRLIDYQVAKRNAEVFMLYDLLINELEMMKRSRINSYNIIKNLLPFFTVIKNPLESLLSRWIGSEGPSAALEKFAKEIGTKEAQSLVSILKTMDSVDRNTALISLQGIQNLFVKSQIENYRRRMKVSTDLASIPIKITHGAVILNFIVVIVTMVLQVLEAARQ